MKNILVVNVNWVGDVIFSSPMFAALKDAYPGAKVTCLAPPRVKGIIEHIPQADEIIIYDDKKEHRGPIGKLRLISRIRKYRFDAAFILHRSLTRALIVYFAGIPIRAGYDKKGRGFFLTHKITEMKGMVHRSDYYLNVIGSFGVSIKDRKTRLVPHEKAIDEVDKLLARNGIKKDDLLVVINPGGNWGLKRWPKRNWALLVSRLLKSKGMKIVVSGAEKDIVLADWICKGSNTVLNLAGKTEFPELFALMKRADVVISADSGPLHIANSLGTDVVALFGPTAPEITGPRGTGGKKILKVDTGCNRSACYHLKCNDNICMQAITVEDVIGAIAASRIKGKAV